MTSEDSDVNQTLTARYFEELDALTDALSQWKTTLRQAAVRIDPSATVSGRVKSHRSLLGKAYRKPNQVRRWEEFGDLVALKAVFPTSKGVRAFTEWVAGQSRWQPSLDEKKSGFDELKYKSMQFDLCDLDIKDSRRNPLKIELQVRTAATDAWYVVDHRLQYKSLVALPTELQRKLRRLIVLTELFDEEVDQVISRQEDQPEYAAARIYEQTIHLAEGLFGGQIRASRPEGLLELLLSAYLDDELPGLDEALGEFVETHQNQLRSTFARHQYDATSYVESLDWLYGEPELVLIAHLTSKRPTQLESVVANSDFDQLIPPMIREFKRCLR